MWVSQDTMRRPPGTPACPPPPLAGANLRRNSQGGLWGRLWVIWVGLVSRAGLSPRGVCTAALPVRTPGGAGWGQEVQGLLGGSHDRMAPRERSWQLRPPALTPDSGPVPLLTSAPDPRAPLPPRTRFPEPQSLPINTRGVGAPPGEAPCLADSSPGGWGHS